MEHVDEFISYGFGQHKYARFVLHYFRLPAVLKNDFREFMEDKKLFCTYGGKRYRVIGASRMGDVWLTSNLENSSGYELRVTPNLCSAWSDDALN